MTAADTAVRVMGAKFATTCVCGGRIEAGMRIRYVKGYAAIHEGCGDPTVALAARATRRRGRGRARSWAATTVCRHEDFPCCGCDVDGARSAHGGDYSERDCLTDEEWREWDR